MNESALIVAVDALIAAVEDDGPGSEHAHAVAGEVRSTGIVAHDSAGLPEHLYREDRTVAARYILGQLLCLIEDWPAMEPGRRLLIAQGCINVAHRFRVELLGDSSA